MATTRKPRRLTPTEHQIQTTFFEEARLRARSSNAWGMLYAIPNGGHRAKKTAAMLRAEGVRSGVPDVHLPVPSGAFHGLYLEFKRERTGRLSPEQRAWISMLRSYGHEVVVVDTVEAAVEAVRVYLGHARRPPTEQSITEAERELLEACSSRGCCDD